MISRNILRGCALIACFGAAIVPVSADTSLPNVVMIMADDLGWSDIAAYRRQQGLGDPIPTPHLDRLCAEGMMFTDAHSAAALCAPTRFSMMTGSNPYRNGRQWGTWQHVATSAFSSNRKHVTVGEVAQAAGYRTAFFGKMHFGGGSNNFESIMPAFPTSYGFDYTFCAQGGIQNAPYLYFENDRFVKINPAAPLNPSVPGTNTDLVQWAAGEYPGPNGSGKIDAGQEGIGDAQWNASQNGIINSKKAVAFIDDHLANHGGQPFLLYYNAPQVHVPHTAPIDFNPNADGTPHASDDPDFVKVKGITGGTHVADITHELDLQVGRILDKLEDPDGDGNTSDSLLPNTLFLFTSDNGGLVNDRGIAGYDSTGVLRSSKANPWEGGHRVPFIAMWPGQVPANTVSDQLIASHDWVAVIYSLTGTPIPADQAMDCVDILPVLRGKQPENVPIRNFLMTQGDANLTTRPLYVMRQGPYALLMDHGRNPAEFYDLSADIRQQNNLIGDPSQQDRIAAMEALYKQYDEENDPPSSPALINNAVIPSVLIDDDFEETNIGSAPLGWTLGNSPTTFTVASDAQSPAGGAGDNRGVRLKNDPATTFENLERTFAPQSGTFHVQFDYRAFNLAQLHNLRIGDGNVGTNRAISLTMSTTAGVAVDTWYRFTLTIDVAADTYIVRVQSLEDSTLDTTTAALPFVSPQAELDLMRFWFNTSSTAGTGDFALDNILVTTDADDLRSVVFPPPIVPRLFGFSFDPLTGTSEISLTGSPGTHWKLIAADDLDFANPDLDPVPLAGATTGVLEGNGFTTDSNGNATVQFNLMTGKPRNFLRAESE